MKMRLGMLMTAVALVVAVSAGATFALFTATTTPVTSTFTSGTLDIALKDNEGNVLTQPLMVAENMAPGDALNYEVNVANIGTLPLSYKIGFTRTDAGGVSTDALADALVMYVYRRNGSEVTLIGSGSMASWATSGLRFQPPLDANGSANFPIILQLPVETGNAAQGGSVVVTLTADATQTQPMPAGTWAFTGPGTTVMTTATGGVAANYNLTISDWNFPVWTWNATTTATKSGTMTFDWRYSGFNAWFDSQVGLEAFAVQPDDTEQVVTLRPFDGASGGFNSFGGGTLTVHQGKAWGYRMNAHHFDSNRTWSGGLDVQMTGFTPE